MDTSEAEETHYTVCHYCEDQGHGEVEVPLHWEDEVWKGICECGETFCFSKAPDED